MRKIGVTVIVTNAVQGDCLGFTFGKAHNMMLGKRGGIIHVLANKNHHAWCCLTWRLKREWLTARSSLLTLIGLLSTLTRLCLLGLGLSLGLGLRLSWSSLALLCRSRQDLNRVRLALLSLGLLTLLLLLLLSWSRACRAIRCPDHR